MYIHIYIDEDSSDSKWCPMPLCIHVRAYVCEHLSMPSSMCMMCNSCVPKWNSYCTLREKICV